MLGIIMVLLCLAAVLFGAFTGNIASVSDGVLEGAKNAVEFCFKLCGSICFFCGLVKVAEKAGITAFISRLLKPFIRFAMPDALKDEKTNQAVCMNISSNMLGLGNAATPFGVKGSRLLYEKSGMGRSLAAFILINTASVQLIPSTVIAIRQAHAAAVPADIIPPILITQVISCTFGIFLTMLFFKKEAKR